MSLSPRGVGGQKLAACGFEFTITLNTVDVPDPGPIPARAPVAAVLCEIPVPVTLAEERLCRIDTGQFGACRFDAEQETIRIRRAAQEPVWQIEVLRGPVLLHALAQPGVVVLHARTAITPSSAPVAFTADSGVGKSTPTRQAGKLV